MTHPTDGIGGFGFWTINATVDGPSGDLQNAALNAVFKSDGVPDVVITVTFSLF